jgi:hypothetical protein
MYGSGEPTMAGIAGRSYSPDTPTAPMKESFEAGFATASALFLSFVPKLLLAVVILVGGYFVAKLLCRILNGVLERVGFNRLVERGGVKSALERSGWEASQILSKTAFYFVMLFVLQLAFGGFGENPISTILTGIIAFLPNVFVAVVIVVLAAAFAAGAKQLISVALGALSYGRIVANAASVAILVVGITAALNQLHIAPAIVNGLFYAMLAAIVGTVIVAAGGGGIAPMRAMWERGLGRIDQEAPRIREAAQGAGERVEAKAESWKNQAKSAAQSSGNGLPATPPPRGEPEGTVEQHDEDELPAWRRERRE